MTEKLRTQSRKASFVEAVVNTAFGFTIQVAAQYALFVIFDTKISTGQFWLFTTAMTVLSVARGFVIRRLFNSEFWKRWKRKQETQTQDGPVPPRHFNCRSTFKPIPGAQTEFLKQPLDKSIGKRRSDIRVVR